jgi:hypothetical protein
MKNRVRILLTVVGVLICLAVSAMADTTVPAKKQTSLKLYITTQEAYETWQKNPEEAEVPLLSIFLQRPGIITSIL